MQIGHMKSDLIEPKLKDIFFQVQDKKMLKVIFSLIHFFKTLIDITTDELQKMKKHLF